MLKSKWFWFGLILVLGLIWSAIFIFYILPLRVSNL